MLSKLIKLANLFNKRGYHKQADIVIKLAIDEKDKIDRKCRNCSKPYTDLFRGWHDQFCSVFCKNRFNDKKKKKSEMATKLIKIVVAYKTRKSLHHKTQSAHKHNKSCGHKHQKTMKSQ